MPAMMPLPEPRAEPMLPVSVSMVAEPIITPSSICRSEPRSAVVTPPPPGVNAPQCAEPEPRHPHVHGSILTAEPQGVTSMSPLQVPTGEHPLPSDPFMRASGSNAVPGVNWHAATAALATIPARTKRARLISAHPNRGAVSHESYRVIGGGC